MNYYRIKSKQPNCKICGKPLKEWNPFSDEHEHITCASKRIADNIMKDIKRDLKALNK